MRMMPRPTDFAPYAFSPQALGNADMNREGVLMDSDDTRVVVVDDVSDAAEALASALEADGYTVRTATDGARALALVDEFQPHCVLLDIDMPGLSGHEVASHLRAFQPRGRGRRSRRNGLALQGERQRRDDRRVNGASPRRLLPLWCEPA